MPANVVAHPSSVASAVTRAGVMMPPAAGAASTKTPYAAAQFTVELLTRVAGSVAARKPASAQSLTSPQIRFLPGNGPKMAQNA